MMLDINEEAMNKKLQIISDLPPEAQSVPWLQDDMKKNFSNNQTKKVDPIPGACIKSWTENGDKIFVNVCHSKELHAPKDISEEQLQKTILEEAPSFIIPMAIGEEKMAIIKDGSEKPVFDILINTNYFEKCMKQPLFWSFTITVMLGSLNDKYNKFINMTKYVVLRNCKIMGSLGTFNIQVREVRKPITKKRLIEELGDIKNENLQDNIKTTALDIKHQNYIIFRSDTGKILIGYFYLPSSSITDITVDVGQNRIIVENANTNDMIDVFLSDLIDNGNTVAYYDNKLHVLKLIMSLKHNGPS